MKHFILTFLLLAVSLSIIAASQDSRPPLSKDELHDLFKSSVPSKVIISTIQKYGIAFQPTAGVLEEFRKAGADRMVLTALREAWHSDVPKPLGDKEIRMMLAEDTPSENIVRAVQERGIDFQPGADYLDEIRSEGAQDALIQLLKSATPRPISMDELSQLLTSRVDQGWIAQRVQQRGVDFGPGKENLQLFQDRGANALLLESIRTAKHVPPFLAQASLPLTLPVPLVKGTAATLICGPSEKDVPVFADPHDLGSEVARLHCGEQITFLGKTDSPPGFDQIHYADGKEGFVSNSYLEAPLTAGMNGVSPPSLIYNPEPAYTPQARRHRLQGTVTLTIVIDSQGKVIDVQESSPPLGEGLDQSAMNTVKTWKFNPAQRDGVPVSVRVAVEVAFRLYHDAP